MKKIKRTLISFGLLFVGLLMFATTSCSNAKNKTTSETLYVKKVKNLSDDFIFGMDASSVISLEQAGVKYYDFDGNESDVFKVLSENGINYIRVRVWNDPYNSKGQGYGGGNNDIEKCIAIGKRATQYGMKLFVDFHYSDFWADPAKQQAPKAWASLSTDAKATALYEYTKDCLTKLKNEGVDVGMVQLGNETNAGKMAGETKWEKTCQLFNAGAKAVREVYDKKTCKVALHFANPGSSDYMDWAKQLQTNNVDYDIFATSYYPYWHGTLDNLKTVLNKITKTYKKETLVAETSYAYTTENYDGWSNTIGTSGYDVKSYPFTIAGQTNHIRELTNTLVQTKNCLGLFYWEGTWISTNGTYPTEGYEAWETATKAMWEEYGTGWASSYASGYDTVDAAKWYGGCAVENQAFFDSTGHPLESLKVFGLMQQGNKTALYVDGVDEASVIHYTDESFTLPKTVKAVMNDNSRKDINVTWESFDIEAAKKKGNGYYDIKGTAEGGFETILHLTIMEYNYAKNYSFDDGMDPWKCTSSTTLNDKNKAQITSENPKTGDNAFHFWGNDANAVNFEVEQEVKDLKAGTYKLTYSILGGVNSGSGSADKQNIYGYVKINGTVKYKVQGGFTSYNDGYHTYVLENIVVNTGDKVTIGVHVEAKQAGSWGDIDDIMLNAQ